MRRNEPVMDRLPEISIYRDTGCEIHSSCLSCPLPQCRYDDPGWVQREERDQRDMELLKLRDNHALPVPELALRFGVSTRTVHRILSRSFMAPRAWRHKGRPLDFAQDRAKRPSCR